MLHEDLLFRHACNDHLTQEEREIAEFRINNDEHARKKWLSDKVMCNLIENFTNDDCRKKYTKDSVAKKRYFDDEYKKASTLLQPIVLMFLVAEYEFINSLGRKILNLRIKLTGFKKELEEYLKLDRKLKKAILDENVIAMEHQLNCIHSDIYSCESENTLPKTIPISEKLNKEPKTERKVLPGKYKWALLAASIAILVAVGIKSFNITDSNYYDKIYTSYYEPYENPYFDRKNPDVMISAGMQNYVSREYELARNNFSQLLETGLHDATANFYLGLTNMELNHFNEAVSYLSDESIIESKYSYQSKWYLVLCYIKLNDKKAAKLLLNDLEKSKYLYHNKAAELLKTL